MDARDGQDSVDLGAARLMRRAWAAGTLTFRSLAAGLVRASSRTVTRALPLHVRKGDRSSMARSAVWLTGYRLGVVSAGMIAAGLAVVLSPAWMPDGGAATPYATGTLAVAVLARFLRTRMPQVVDRPRYEALSQIEEFMARVRNGSADPELVESALRAALDDRSLKVCYRLPEGAIYVDASGNTRDVAPHDACATTPIDRRGDRMAIVLHDRSLTKRPDVLRSTVFAASLAVEIARLHAEASHQLAEIESSRARIADARAGERRRLERDLHDGAQQRLVALGISLRLIQARISVHAPASRTLDAAVDEVAAAVRELRTLARGLPWDRDEQGAPPTPQERA